MSAIGLKLLVCLAAFVCGNQDPNQLLTSSDQTNTSPIATQNTEQLKRQIRSLQISAMEPNSTIQSNTLNSLVDQIQTLRLPSSRTDIVATAPAEPVNPSEKRVTPKMDAAPDKAGMRAAALTAIDAVTDPLDPLAAADALYQMGDSARAMRFYEMAVEQKSDPNVLSRQWAMYQAANCVRYQAADRAIELYAKLLAEYPNNPWAAAALAQKRNLEWLKKNEMELKRRIEGDASKQ